MSCEAWKPALMAYADGELSSSDTRKLEQHLANCPECTGDALRLVQLKRLTNVAGQRYEPSAAFKRRIETKISRRRAMWPLMWLAPVAAAAVIFVAVFGIGLWVKSAQRDQTWTQLTDMHVSTLASANRVDVVSSDRHTVKPWFQGKLPFTFDLPELANSPYRLVGGRMAYMNHSPGAQLLFELRKHEISVFIFPESVGRGFGAISTNRENFNLETWSQNGLRFFVVGDASHPDIDGLAQLLKHP